MTETTKTPEWAPSRRFRAGIGSLDDFLRDEAKAERAAQRARSADERVVVVKSRATGHSQP